MNDNPQVTSFSTVQPKSPLYKNKIILLLLFILLETIYTLVLLNFRTKPQNQIVQPAPVLPAKKSIAEDELPIAASFLKNPIVYQWSGSVEGKLISKNEDSITLEDAKGNNIVIPLRVSGKDTVPSTMTFFIDLSTPTTKVPETIPVSKVSIGSTLRGNFFVVPGSKDKIVGSSFTIIKKGS